MIGISRRAVWAGGLGAAALCMLTGCGVVVGGPLTLRSAEDVSVVLAGNYRYGLYALEADGGMHVVLVSGELESPESAVHLRLYWSPRAARTPFDSNATNATVRCIIFEAEGAAVYEGGGYLFPQSDPVEGTLQGELRSSSLRLVDATDRFQNALGLTQAVGSFSARRDDAGTMRLLRSLGVELGRRLGYPRVVEVPDPLLKRRASGSAVAFQAAPQSAR